MTGSAAQAEIEGRPGVSEALILAHQDAALVALIFIELTGFVAWLGLWQYRRFSRPAKGILPAVLLCSVMAVGLAASAATKGGEILHEEIRAVGRAPALGPESGLSTAIVTAVIDRPWIWPAAETIHFIGLWLLFGVVMVVNLRMLGMMKSVPFSSLHRLLPWGVLGFGVNLITGIVFFVATPGNYLEPVPNIALQAKIVLMMLAGVSVLYHTLFDQAWEIASGMDAPATSKVVAASSLFLWLGIIYFGQMLPFIGNSF